MPEINTVLAGYRLRSLIATAQYTQVYEVVEVQSNRHFAMKILLPEASDNSDHRKTLFNEAEVGVQLSHPNVIRIVKVNRSPETPHFIMEFFPAGSLRERVKKKDAEFVKQYARKIFKGAATGLAYMNSSGYVHRDVKPDNILVNAVGDTKMIDFAISKKIPTGFGKWFYKRRKPQGTPSFMSPEQIRDELPDGRDDIYSFGCTLYEIVCGRPPFRGTTQNDLLSRQLTEKPAPLTAYNPDLTDEFSALVLKMIAKKRADRPEHFHQVLIELRKIKQIFKSVVEKDLDEN